jgi:hypothetical protein
MFSHRNVGFTFLDALPAHDAFFFVNFLGLVGHTLNGQIGTDFSAFLATGAKILIYGYDGHYKALLSGAPAFTTARASAAAIFLALR